MAMSDEMKEMAKMLHDTCVEEIGVGEDLIVNANKGEFAEDTKLKCYMKCLMDQVSGFTDDGEIDTELLISMLPEEVVVNAAPVMRSCGTVKGADDCDTVYQTQKCYYSKSPEGIQMEWWPLTRDCTIYSISIGLLTVMMWDGSITWIESTILMTLYFVYFFILFCDKITSRWVHNFAAKFKKNKSLAETPDKDNVEKNEMFGSYRPYFHGELVIEYRNSITRASIAKASRNGSIVKSIEAELPLEEYEEPGTPFTKPTGKLYMRIWFYFLWPLRFLLFITVPDCRFKKVRRFYPITFIMCIVWIAITSYIVSWMITVVGDTIGIADAVMGLTFLAAGGSLPEAVSSVIMARQGDGAMGLSNSIGANTLDILLCLGLPWLIKTTTSQTTIQIVSSTITYSFLALVVTVILLYIVVALNGFRLNKKVGVGCLIMYAMFITLATLLELNVFFFVNLPMCDPTD